MHIEKSPGVHPVGADIRSLADIVIVVGKRSIDIVPPGIGGAGPPMTHIPAGLR